MYSIDSFPSYYNKFLRLYTANNITARKTVAVSDKKVVSHIPVKPINGGRINSNITGRTKLFETAIISEKVPSFIPVKNADEKLVSPSGKYDNDTNINA